jgi:hypothetical protein
LEDVLYSRTVKAKNMESPDETFVGVDFSGDMERFARE